MVTRRLLTAFEADKAEYKFQQDQFQRAKDDHNAFMAARIPLPWEQTLKSIIDSDMEPRAIHWFYDPIGETGKTANAKSLYFNHNAFYCSGGKPDDIYHSYNYEPIVVFDVSTLQEPQGLRYLYKVLEDFKDGIFLGCAAIIPIARKELNLLCPPVE